MMKNDRQQRLSWDLILSGAELVSTVRTYCGDLSDPGSLEDYYSQLVGNLKNVVYFANKAEHDLKATGAITTLDSSTFVSDHPAAFPLDMSVSIHQHGNVAVSLMFWLTSLAQAVEFEPPDDEALTHVSLHNIKVLTASLFHNYREHKNGTAVVRTNGKKDNRNA